MKIKKSFVICGAILASAIGIGVAVPIIINTNKANDPKQTHVDKQPGTNFTSNINDIKNSIKETPLTTFKPTNQNSNPWEVLSSDPNASIYKEIFNKVDTNLVLNDLKSYIVSIQEANPWANLNVSSLPTTNEEIQVLSSSNEIKVEFQIYNNSSFNRRLIVSNFNTNTYISSKTIANVSITLKGKPSPAFYGETNSSGVDQLFANYTFDSINLNINGKEHIINNSSFQKYSKTLNVVVNNVSNANSYLDIAEQGNGFLSSLSLATIQDNVLETFNAYLQLTSNNMDTIQNLLQSLVTNPTIYDFIQANGGPLVDFIDIVLKDNNVNFDLAKIKPLIVDILADKPIHEILSNGQNKQLALDLISQLDPSISSIASMVVDLLSTPEGIDEVCNMLKGMGVEDLIGPEILNIIPQLKEKGLLTFILSNLDTISNFIPILIPNEAVVNTIVPILINLSKYDIRQAHVIDFVLENIKYSDGEKDPYLKTLLSYLLASNPSILDLINQIIFDNPNLTTDNLIKSLDVIANPKSATKNGVVVRYKEWFDSIEKTPTFASTNTYEPASKKISLDFSYKFVFKSNIYWNISNLLAFAPDNITMNGSSIPLKTIAGIIPDWLGLITNDYLSFEISANDLLQYDVVNINNENYLNWKLFTKLTIDAHLPQTVKSLFDSASFIIKNNVLVNLVKNVFFHKYDFNQIFSPTRNIINNPKVNNYDSNALTNQAIFKKDITPERMQELTTQIKDSISNMELEDMYSWKSGFINYKIYKVDTVSSFELSNDIINELFDLTNYKDVFKCFLTVERIIEENNILNMITVPKIEFASIKLVTPYNVYTNNGKMQSVFEYSF